ncbi:unnamed protein product [Symbiodinium sp. CCMP2592]|nr:unnamed protein product [Symbiodinium sp. CCMP2592]
MEGQSSSRAPVLGHEQGPLESSGEPGSGQQRGRSSASKAERKAVKKGLGQELRDKSDGDDSESDEEDDIGQATQAAAASSSKVLAPGTPGKGRKVEEVKKKKKKKKSEIDVQELLASGLSKGQSASEILPLAVLAMVLKKDKGSKAKGSTLHGGFSSDSESDEADFSKSGIKAVVSLSKLHARIRSRPSKIYHEFEREIVEDMGIVAGQAWTIRDYLKKQSWEKFKGIFRCAVMDAAAYEMLRSGETESAIAQLAQNMKGELQAVMSGGDWEAAWLLTGLADPLSRREFAGSKEEMAVVSGYLEALSKLNKPVRPAMATRWKKRKKEYFAWLERAQGSLLEGSGTDPPLFPSALPYPEVVCLRSGTKGPLDAAQWCRVAVNALVAWSNFVVMGCPDGAGSAYEPRAARRSVESIRPYADKLLGEVVNFFSPGMLSGALSCEGKREDLEHLVASAERVAIPEEAGQVDPREVLEKPRAEVVDSLPELRLPEALWGEEVVTLVACHRVTEQEETPLLRRLLAAKMITFVPEQDLPRCRDGRLLLGGLFAVRKNEDEDCGHLYMSVSRLNGYISPEEGSPPREWRQPDHTRRAIGTATSGAGIEEVGFNDVARCVAEAPEALWLKPPNP